MSQAAARFDQVLFPDDGNVFGTRSAVSLEACLAGGKKNVRGKVLVDARGQRHHKHGVRAFVAIAGVERYDNDGSSAFFRRVNRQLDEPYLAAKRVSGNGKRRHSGMLFARKLAQGEVAPLRLFLYVFIGEFRVVPCHGLLERITLLCLTHTFNQFIEN